MTTGRYLDMAEETNDVPLEDRMQRLTAQLEEQQPEGARLGGAVAASIQALGVGDTS